VAAESPQPSDRAERFAITTYGCQMNVHDSEKVANLLYHAGLRQVEDADDSDLLVINTCSIREKAENQLYSHLGGLVGWKRARPGRVLGVGGCVAQQVGDDILTRFPQVDFVFGTHNLRLVPAMVAAARQGHRRVCIDEDRSPARFELPARHAGYRGSSPGRAYVTVMEGCDLFCSFCIVPHTRGREISRALQEILGEAESLVRDGVREITLLGQAVNAYGRHDRGRAGETVGFAELLRQLDATPGLERIRYASPHPVFYDEPLVRAHGELESLCPHAHLPVQSGSSSVLERMRRRHDRRQFLRLVDDLRGSCPDIALTTDLIVGFPGETAAEFRETLSLVREAGFVDAYSFKYSPRPGTAAARLPDPVPPAEAQERLVELQQLLRSQTLAYHRQRVGGSTQILIEGESRKGRGQCCGRDPYHRVVNVELGDTPPPSPGTIARIEIVEATPHSLIGQPT
jgi:tRNA-2-methylthio-N6-dimethylallyladenosine synthase